MKLLCAAAALLCSDICAAYESSSAHYSNLSASGGQPVASAPAAAARPARLAPKPSAPIAQAPAAAVALAAPVPPAAPRADGWRWLLAAAAVLAAGAFALRRREGASRRASSETLALAAHELQSPLAAIESYLDLMASEAPAASREARRWLEDLGRMRTTTSHLRRTIGDILDMTRVEDGRVKLSLRPIELGPLVKAAAAAYVPHAAARGVSLSAETGAAALYAQADPDRLGQVLDNLLGNALKFTPSGRAVTLLVRASASKTIIEVLDAGVGVPKDKRDRLFGKFQRLGPAVDGTEGTGLGLYLSRRLIEAQGGRLDYEPAPGGGSIFRVTLPKSETDHREMA